MPTSVRARAPIALPLERCWEKLRDLRRAADYVPGVSGVEITTERSEGLGASRRVTHAQFGAMDETVVEWKEGESIAVRLHRGDAAPFPFREATFRYALRADGPACEIETTMIYALRFGALGAWLDRLLFRRVMQGSVRDVALALARHYETDAPVGPDALRALRRASR